MIESESLVTLMFFVGFFLIYAGSEIYKN